MEDKNMPDDLKADEKLPENDEEILELTDVVEILPGDEEEILELTDVVEILPGDEKEILELTDVVEAPPSDYEEILELTDVVEILPGDEKHILELDDIIDEDFKTSASLADDIIDTLGVDLAPESVDAPHDFVEEDPIGGADAAKGAASISIGQIEDALERVIERMYSEKIEGIIVDAIEKAVQKEIEKMSALLKDAIGNDT